MSDDKKSGKWVNFIWLAIIWTVVILGGLAFIVNLGQSCRGGGDNEFFDSR